MSYQDIIDACEKVWEANKADCNHFLKAVAEQLGVDMFATGDNADAICSKLATAVGWTKTADLALVERNATAGQFIIAGLNSHRFTPPRNNGHVAVVVHGDDAAHPGFPLAYWGTLGGVGAKDKSIRYSFIPGIDLPNATYYCKSLTLAAREDAGMYTQMSKSINSRRLKKLSISDR